MRRKLWMAEAVEGVDEDTFRSSCVDSCMLPKQEHSFGELAGDITTTGGLLWTLPCLFRDLKPNT